MTPEQQAEELLVLLERLNKDNARADDVEKLFGAALEAVAKVKQDILSMLDTRGGELSQETDGVYQKLKVVHNNVLKLSKKMDQGEAKSTKSLDAAVKRLAKDIAAVQAMIPVMPDLTPIEAEIRRVEAKIPTIPEMTTDTGAEIVDKVNALPTNDDKLKIDAKHIKNLPKNGGGGIWGVSGIKGITPGSNIGVEEVVSEYPTVSFLGYTGVTHITVGPTAPSNPNLYDLWVDTA